MGYFISEKIAVQRVDLLTTKSLVSIKKMISYGAWLIFALVAITKVDAQCDEITYGEKPVEGLAWEEKCYYAIESYEGFQYVQAEAACASINGQLAPHVKQRYDYCCFILRFRRRLYRISKKGVQVILVKLEIRLPDSAGDRRGKRDENRHDVIQQISSRMLRRKNKA